MDRKLKFIITDVFAEHRYSGNQLATFLDASSLSDQEMQQIAQETNFSETTFILSQKPGNGGYRVRIFTPGDEVDFAGHPTLGTAYVIRNYLLKESVETVTLDLNVGQVPVTWVKQNSGEALPVMQQVAPKFGQVAGSEEIARVLNLNPGDIDTRWPIEAVSTGLPFFIVPLQSMQALKKISIQLDLYHQLINTAEAKLILAFCPGGYTEAQALGVRVFGEYYGITEDPATGSGNGCLAAYLVKHRYFGSESIDIQTGQGYEIGRPSTLFLNASEQKDRIHVQVGGNVVTVAEGFWK